MSGISSNASFSPQPSSSLETQENGITQTKTQKAPVLKDASFKNQGATPSHGMKHDASRGESADKSKRAPSDSNDSTLDQSSDLSDDNGDNISSFSSMSDENPTANAAFQDQSAQPGSKFVNSSTLSQKASDYVSTSIQSKVALNSMTLKVQSLVIQGSPKENAFVNKNGAPQLPEPSAIVEELESQKADSKNIGATKSEISQSTSNNGTTDTDESSSEDPLGSTTDAAPKDQLNVFAIAEHSGVISVNSQLNAVASMIAGANAQENYQLSDIQQQEEAINNAVQAAQQVKSGNSKSNTMTDVGWAVNALMIVAGCVLIATGLGAGIGAALIVGATLSMIMMSQAGSQITNALVNVLEHNSLYDMPSKDAQVVAAVIIAVVIMAASMGGEASGIGEALNEATLAARGAEDFSSTASSTASSTDSTAPTGKATSTAKNGANSSLSESDKAISSPTESANSEEEDALTPRDADVGLNASDKAAATNATLISQSKLLRPFEAFGASLSKSANNAFLRTLERIGRDSISEVLQKGGAGIHSLGEDAVMLPLNVARGFCEIMTSALKGFCTFLEDTFVTGENYKMLTNLLYEIRKASVMENLQRTLSTAYKALPKDAVSLTFFSASLLQAGLGMYKAYIDYEIGVAEKIYSQAEGEQMIEAALVNEMQSLIENSTVQINNVLKNVTQEINNADAVLASMSTPLQNLVSF